MLKLLQRHGWKGAFYSPENRPVELHISKMLRKVTQDDGAPRKWTIEAEYSSKPIKENESEENPLNRPARIRWRTANYRQAIWKDINDKAILNSAGDYFDPPVEVDRAYWTVSVSKNVADVPTFMLDYENAVNNAAITIGGVVIGQYEAKISDIEVSELKIEGDYQYFEFSYTLERRREKWIPLKVLDQGYRQIDPANSEKRIHIMDDSSVKRPVASLRLLDGAEVLQQVRQHSWTERADGHSLQHLCPCCVELLEDQGPPEESW